MNIIKDCQAYVNLKLSSGVLSRCYEQFLLLKMSVLNNVRPILSLRPRLNSLSCYCTDSVIIVLYLAKFFFILILLYIPLSVN